jgi:hypothetical protein
LIPFAFHEKNYFLYLRRKYLYFFAERMEQTSQKLAKIGQSSVFGVYPMIFHAGFPG